MTQFLSEINCFLLFTSGALNMSLRLFLVIESFPYLCVPDVDILLPYLCVPDVDIPFPYLCVPDVDIPFPYLCVPDVDIPFAYLCVPDVDIPFAYLCVPDVNIPFAYLCVPDVDIPFAYLCVPDVDILKYPFMVKAMNSFIVLTRRWTQEIILYRSNEILLHSLGDTQLRS